MSCAGVTLLGYPVISNKTKSIFNNIKQNQYQNDSLFFSRFSGIIPFKCIQNKNLTQDLYLNIFILISYGISYQIKADRMAPG